MRTEEPEIGLYTARTRFLSDGIHVTTSLVKRNNNYQTVEDCTAAGLNIAEIGIL